MFHGHFLEKSIGIKEFHGLHDDLKIIWRKLTPGHYRVLKLGPAKNGIIAYNL